MARGGLRGLEHSLWCQINYHYFLQYFHFHSNILPTSHEIYKSLDRMDIHSTPELFESGWSLDYCSGAAFIAREQRVEAWASFYDVCCYVHLKSNFKIVIPENKYSC